MATPVEIAEGFICRLREAGVSVPLSRGIGFSKALEVLGIDDRSKVYWSGMSTLIGRPEDIPSYTAAFRAYFDGVRTPPKVEGDPLLALVIVDDGEEPPPEEDPSDDGEELEVDEVVSLRFSSVESLRERDFGTLSHAELREAYALMDHFSWHPPKRPSRRYVPSKGRGRLDLRATVRASLANGGEAMERRMSSPGEKVRRTVFICDISGSMEPYSRALVRFVHAAMMGTKRVEVFTLGTRLTRITREMNTHDPEQAMAKSAGAVRDWSGGTRLGDVVREFNRRYGSKGVSRGANVVILSDGWDRGDPAVLGAEMRRLRMTSHRVIWVNPLRASPGYAPLARGMAAALPHVDKFLDGHSLDSLERLAEEIAQ